MEVDFRMEVGFRMEEIVLGWKREEGRCRLRLDTHPGVCIQHNLVVATAATLAAATRPRRWVGNLLPRWRGGEVWDQLEGERRGIKWRGGGEGSNGESPGGPKLGIGFGGGYRLSPA